MEDERSVDVQPQNSSWSLVRYGLFGFGLVALVIGVGYYMKTPRTPVNSTVTLEAREGVPALGPLKAPITIIEYSDFECPFCKQAAPILSEVVRAYPQTVRLEYRHFPIYSKHPRATAAAMASMCAHRQDKFWQYHDVLFANQTDYSDGALLKYARQINLDIGKFSTCFSNNEPLEEVSDDFMGGMKLQVSGTPTFFVNGEKLQGTPTFDQWRAMIEPLSLQ